MDTMCTQDLWAIKAVQQLLLYLRVHTLSEGARPTQGLIIVSRVRRRDMARLFDSGKAPLYAIRYG